MTKKEIAIKKELSNTNNPGRFGRAFEIECARKASKKSAVAKQGETDVHIKMEINGTIRYVPAECKTNGGRVDTLLTGANRAPYVIYRLEFVQKHKASKKHGAYDELRKVAPVIIPTELFINMLRECNALKEVRHGGEVDGIAIQPSSKQMYERLSAYRENYNMGFDNETVYADWMFEGVEL